MFNIADLIKFTAKPKIPTMVAGIDVGSSSIKVVELESRAAGITLRTYGELQLSAFSKENTEGSKNLGQVVKLDESEKTTALKTILEEVGVESKDGVLSLPLSNSFVTVMSLTSKPDEDVSAKVRIEARKYIPVPLTDVTLDWTELDTIPGTPENVKEILVAAVENNSFAQMTGMMATVGQVSQPSEIELFSSLRSLSHSEDETVAVLDLGAGSSKLYISNNGVLRKIHRLKVGGAQATKKIADLLSCDFETAENMKRNYVQGKEHSEDVRKAVVSTFERPLQEFRRAISQYEMRVGKKIDRVVISGGSAIFPEMGTFVSYMFDKEVEVANPFNKVATPSFLQKQLKEIGPSYSVALGAALRPFSGF